MALAAQHGLLVLAAAGVLLGGGPNEAERVKKELDALRGTWRLVDLEVAGKRLTAEANRNKSLAVFDGNRLTRWSDCGFFSYTLKLTPGKVVRAIDLVSTDPSKPVTTLGIYEFKGDTLRPCTLHRAGGERPTGFRTSANPDALEYAWVVSVFRRQSRD